MVFDAENAHRRRSSLVSTEGPHLDRRPGSAERTEDTACFVHHLLEKQRRSRKPNVTSLSNINEDTKADKAVINNNESATQSRMLTKGQLADMAYGVRKLSKKLGNVRLKLKVKTVFLLTKAHDESLIGYTREMVDWLLAKERDAPYIVYGFFARGRICFRLIQSRYVEDTLEHNHKFDAKSIIAADTSREGRLKYWNNDLCKKHPLTFDFAVTVLCPRVLLRSS